MEFTGHMKLAGDCLRSFYFYFAEVHATGDGSFMLVQAGSAAQRKSQQLFWLLRGRML
jgi:hypothetical protein